MKKFTKKLFAVILVFVFFINFVFPVSSASFSRENGMNAIELSVKKFNAKIKGKSKIELADEILLELGMDEKFIKSIPDDKKEIIASSVEIYTKEEYVKCNENGQEMFISKNEYDNYEEINNQNNSDVSTYGSIDVGSKTDDGKDSLFRRNLLIFKPIDNTKGKYIILGSYEYKKMPFWRGTDIISISGEDMVFARKDFSVSVFYEEENVVNGKTETRKVTEVYNMNTIEDATDLQGLANAIAFKYDLPNDVVVPTFDGTGGGMKTEYSNLAFVVNMVANVQDPTTVNKFNIYFNYFHQKIGLGSIGLSISASGGSVSVSPKICYEMHQIMLDDLIVYQP